MSRMPGLRACTISDSVAEEGLSEWLDNRAPSSRGHLSALPAGDGNRGRIRIEFGIGQGGYGAAVFAAMFHDIGKAKIPLAVLDKPGSLEPGERA